MGRIIKSFFSDPTTGIKIHCGFDLVKLGSKYGAWVIPSGYLGRQSICYLVGAGEDISFDCEIAKRYKSRVYIVDPTPKAKRHFERVKLTVLRGEFNKDAYFLDKESFNRIRYLPYGVAGKSGLRRFYRPKNPTHISHSIVNLQDTKSFFKAKCFKIKDLIERFGHKKVSLLKLDIEGTEYEVIDSLVTDGIFVDILCLEYDEVHSPKDDNYQKRIKKSAQKLIKSGYLLVSVDSLSNYTFIKKGVIGRRGTIGAYFMSLLQQTRNYALFISRIISRRVLG